MAHSWSFNAGEIMVSLYLKSCLKGFFNLTFFFLILIILFSKEPNSVRWLYQQGGIYKFKKLIKIFGFEKFKRTRRLNK